jgi:hypothetical protein
MSSLDPFSIQLETAWTDGSHNGAALWRAMKLAGFIRSLSVRHKMGDGNDGKKARRHGTNGQARHRRPAASRAP